MKTLHDIIQKNMEAFEKEFSVPEHAILRNGGREICTLCGFPAQPDIMMKELKQFLLSSQLSIIQAIDEWAEKNKWKVADFDFGPDGPPTGAAEQWEQDEQECKIHNQLLSELRSFLSTAKTKLQ